MVQEQEGAPSLQILGEVGDRLAYREDLNQWGVKHVT